MLIPKQLDLAGITITIQPDDKLIENKKCIGEASYNSQKIIIDASATPSDIFEQAYFHELVHWIFYVMNEDELRNNEKLVDLFGHFLYQAIKTSGYTLPEDCANALYTQKD
jgi:hypothetical protein